MPQHRIFFIFFELESLEIFNYVTDGNKSVDVGVLDFNVELFLAKQNQIGKLDGVDAEVTGKLSVEGDVSFVDLKLINKQFFQLFKHCKFLQNDLSLIGAEAGFRPWTGRELRGYAVKRRTRLPKGVSDVSTECAGG